ncbi:PhzF family phenazine biosynthesis protein [Vibrio coralliirubri]|uniref:PhzF family phenazine biosynthesis protein n=1 Tax=Vibrio coralliirubri TaxID=1516159 RepID=UPI0039C06757
MELSSRYFAPWVGVNEDPVTGSAHCALAVYWSRKLGKRVLSGISSIFPRGIRYYRTVE